MEEAVNATVITNLKAQLDQLMQAYLARGTQISQLTNEKTGLEQNFYLLQKELERLRAEKELVGTVPEVRIPTPTE